MHEAYRSGSGASVVLGRANGALRCVQRGVLILISRRSDFVIAGTGRFHPQKVARSLSRVGTGTRSPHAVRGPQRGEERGRLTSRSSCPNVRFVGYTPSAAWLIRAFDVHIPLRRGVALVDAVEILREYPWDDRGADPARGYNWPRDPDAA